MKVKDFILYALVGAGVGYLFYKFTKAPKALAKPEEEKKTIVLVKFPVPKVVGSGGLQKIVNMAKPKRILPSLVPLGVTLEWDPIMLDSPIGKFGVTPPKKFISLKTIQEVKRAIDQSQVKIEDKGIYWEVSFSIYV